MTKKLRVKIVIEKSYIAKAKVNLALHVIGRLPNGLHLLDSLVAFPDIGDNLIFEKANDLSLSVEGHYGPSLHSEIGVSGNIVIKAARMLSKSHGASIRLIKNLPIASGIGGGSSNAAVTLRVLSKMWNIPLPSIEKIVTLGSDIPICLSDCFQRLQGVGDEITLLKPPPRVWIVLANPGVQVCTATVFNGLKLKNNPPLDYPTNIQQRDDFFHFLRSQRNDLEKVTCKICPEVKVLLNYFKNSENCRVSRMSGSGATCFGLFSTKKSAEDAANKLKESFPRFWVKTGALFSDNSRHNKFSQF